MSIFKDLFRLDEGIFDTDIYKELSDKYKNEKFPSLSVEEKEKVDALLAEPCALPYEQDGTLEAWLLRISLWGEISINWKNPENNTNKKITTDEFLEYIDNQEWNKMYGKWKLEEVKINKIRFYRKFWGIEGKNIVEEIIVNIKLRPDLQKKLKQIGRFF